MKKIFAVMLTLALAVSSVFWISSTTANAATASGLSAQINAISGLSADVAGNVVIVTGTAHLTTNLLLNIDAGVTVNWNATLTGNATANNYLLTLTGSGAFTLGDGGRISATTGAGGTVYISGGVTLNVTDGAIESPGSGSAVTIAAGTLWAVININGNNGKIASVPNGYAINDGSGMTASINNTIINISAGLVESGSACAIRSTGIASVVTVSGGEVRNNAASNTNSTIYMNYAPAPNDDRNNIVVSGGIVRTTNAGNQSYVLQSTQNILISGGEVRALAGRAINLVGNNSTATVTGGRVSTVSGAAISTATTTLDEVNDASVVISGGVIEATGTGTAVRITGANSTVEISGDAKVLATSGLAIDASGRPGSDSVRVNGGFVFAWGNATSRVISPESKLYTNVGGVIAAWNTTTGIGAAPYRYGGRDDLSMLPANSVSWNDNDTLNDFTDDGIIYSTGFHTLDVEVIRNLFTLTIINGITRDGGETTLILPEGAVVDITTQETPIDHTLVPPFYYPINGNVFNKWETNNGGTFGNASDMDTTFTMPSGDVAITATFNPRYWFSITGGNIISPRNFYPSPPGSADYSASSGYYPAGEVISIHRNTGTEWNYSSSNPAHLLLIDDINAVDTTFTMPDGPAHIGTSPLGYPFPSAPTRYTLTVNGGSVVSTSTGGPPDPSGYYAGTNLNIAAGTPPAGQEFSHWEKVSGNGRFADLNNHETVFVILAHSEITAVYKYKTYNLSVEGGTAEGTNPRHVNDEITIAATAPQAGMVFSGWTIESGGGKFDDPFSHATTFHMSDSDAVISAHYEFLNYLLTVENGVDILGTGEYHFGKIVPVSADPPPPGMRFAGWAIISGGGSFGSLAAMDTTFIMPAGNATVRATYVAIGQTPPPDHIQQSSYDSSSSSDRDYDLFTVRYYRNVEQNELPWRTQGPFRRGGTFRIPENIPTRSGFEFMHWTLNPGGQGIPYNAGAQFTIHRDMNFYAQWREIAGESPMNVNHNPPTGR